MKREHGFLFAGALGLAAVLGFLAVRKYLAKKDEECYYRDFHNLFDINNSENQHGIEFYAVN